MSNTQNNSLCYPETSAHSWSLTHLQASLRVSDATVLNMTSRRTELIPQKAVKYEVRSTDRGAEMTWICNLFYLIPLIL